uniref:Uncharacterized protein n=1 Tax=Pyricularia oryzae (strain P131) TaxID=1143193 RepID=L7J5Q7_PYRO1
MPAVGPRYKKTAGHVLPRRCRAGWTRLPETRPRTQGLV